VMVNVLSEVGASNHKSLLGTGSRNAHPSNIAKGGATNL